MVEHISASRNVSVTTTSTIGYMTQAGNPSGFGIAAQCGDQLEMEKRRQLPRTLMGGTWAMRKMGEEYLPREPREKTQAWDRRMKRTALKNYFKKTVKNLVGRVFVKDLVINCRNEDLRNLLEDVDLQGNHINVFAQNLLERGLVDGINCIFVDLPKRPIDINTGQEIFVSLDDVRKGKYRPYMVEVNINRVRGWRVRIGDRGPYLTMIRFDENTEVAAGEFGTQIQERIRVLDLVQVEVRPGDIEWRQRFRVYQKLTENEMKLLGRTTPDPKDELWGYGLVDEGITSAQQITFYPFYADKERFMVGASPLEDLAWLNLMHFQSTSDQRNILHVARVPILFGKGFEKDDDGNYEVEMEVGANIAIYGPFESDMKYVEHNGMAIAAGQKDLENLEEDMVMFGLEFQMSRPSHESASARIIDHSESVSPLRKTGSALTDCLENALKQMALYLDLNDVEDEPTCKTAGELGMSVKDSAAVANLINMRRDGEISRERFLLELQRMSFLSDDMVILDEIAAIEKEQAKKQADALAIAQATAARPPGGEEDGEGEGGRPPEELPPTPPAP